MQSLLLLIPMGVYASLTLALATKPGWSGLLEGFVKAHLAVFAFLAFSTEALSLFDVITFPLVLTVWLLFVSVSLVLMVRRWTPRDFHLPAAIDTRFDKFVSGVVILILLATLVTGIVYPPNNWDSMLYHLTRVCHWVQNRNVNFFPTSYALEISQPPLAEWGILHVMVLSGQDRFAFSVQWISFVVLIILGCLLAQELGLSKKHRMVSAVAVATLPMAIVQASSTQNDLVVSSFVVSFVLFVLRLRRGLGVENTAYAGMALGLALLTKGTGYIYCAALGFSLGVQVLFAYRRAGFFWARSGGVLLAAVITGFLFNAGHWTRNYRLTRDPLSMELGGSITVNEEISVAAFVSNTVRQATLHLGAPLEAVRRKQELVLEAILGRYLNNPKTTFGGSPFRVHFSHNEDCAGNHIHILLVFAFLVLFPRWWLRGSYRALTGYASSALFAAAFFLLLVRWQIWGSRLHTPLFVLAAPLVATLIAGGTREIVSRLQKVVVLGMALYGCVFAVHNSTRSLLSLEWLRLPRTQLYYQTAPEMFNDHQAAIGALNGPLEGQVGLLLGGEGPASWWEYPFWRLTDLRTNTGEPLSLRHVGVQNVSRNLGSDLPLPQYVISTAQFDRWEHSREYSATYFSSRIAVFKRLSQTREEP